MNYYGIIIGIGSFITIGILHPVVIKAEYFIGKKCWPLFAVGGFISVVLSLVVDKIMLSAILSVLGFSLFWSIRELFEQEKRVQKGWYPANPLKNKEE